MSPRKSIDVPSCSTQRLKGPFLVRSLANDQMISNSTKSALPFRLTREDFRDDDPRAWSPRVSERHSEDPHERTRNPARCTVLGPVMPVLARQDCHDYVASANQEMSMIKH